MGYWSNGTEWMLWRESWCDRCEHGRDNECPVYWISQNHSHGDQCHCADPEGRECKCSLAKVQMRLVLNQLVEPVKKTAADGLLIFDNECRMFVPRKTETRQQQVMREIREAAGVVR